MSLWNTAFIESPKIPSKKMLVDLPRGQVSYDDPSNPLTFIQDQLEFLEPGYHFDVVPIIRKLKDANPDVSQAFRDVIQLANTGHDLIFDPKVSPAQQEDMKLAISEASKNWCPGTAGLHGIINRMFSQLLVAGAVANEWVPDNTLKTIDRVKFILPEQIRYARDKSTKKWVPYQKLKNTGLLAGMDVVKGQYIKLNPNTFKYYGHLGDAEAPYGTPPYLASLSGISTQSRMLQNIDQIVSTMGILGWASALMDKPDQDDGESDSQYRARLQNVLTELKQRVEQQLRQGVSVGFKDDHEFEFQQTVKSAQGVDSLWANNEQQIASGLDFDSAFMGRSYNTSEGMISILFTKMVSQLTNIQNIVEYNLTYGLSLFLKLQGFNFKYLKTEFRKSTITDDLKHQQALEIKTRVALQNYLMGAIDHHGYTIAAGYEKAAKNGPIVPIEMITGKSAQEAKEDKANKDAKSDRKGREKRKQTPIRKTKPITQE